MEKHKLSKIDFELIDDAFKTLLQSRPDPLTADKIADLRNIETGNGRKPTSLPPQPGCWIVAPRAAVAGRSSALLQT
jgi:hypothetical protein